MYALKTVQKIAAGAAIAGLVGSLAVGLMPTLAAANTGPSVVLASNSTQAPASTNDSMFVITATVSSSTSDFTQSNVSVSNGAVSNFSGSGTDYTFDVTPTVAPGDNDPVHHTVTVQVNSGAFDDNQASNVLTFQYAAGAPSVTITSGPTEGATVASGTAAFTFTSNDANAVFTCSIVDQASADSFFSCGSPQNYTLPDGSYRFAVEATNSVGTASTSVDFTMAAATTTATSTSSGDSDTNVPVIDITGGPSNGSTVNPADAVFTWTVDDASSTVQCSMVAASSTDSFTSCTSPQSFTSSADNSYRFIVEATNNAGTASTTINFTVSSTTPTIASSSSSSSSSSGSSGNGQTTAPGSGGGSQPVGSSPTAPSGSGVGNNGELGTSDAHAVIPGGSGSSASTGGNAVIPTAPASSGVSTVPTSGKTSSPSTPVVSQSSGGSALVGSNAPTTVTTPGIPNTGSESTVTPSSSDQTLNVSSSSLAAAAASSGGSSGIPAWVWIMLAGIVLIGIGIWALRQPA